MPLDVGMGILLAIFVSRTGLLPLSAAAVAAGILFSLLPDLDFLLHLARQGTGRFSHEHRDLLHNPLVFISAGTIFLAFMNGGLALLFALSAIAHFLHDSVGMGWGVRWAYPFSKKYYKFFSDPNGHASRRFLVSWTPDAQRAAAAEFGDPHWLSDYLKLSREFLIELGVLVAALILLFAAGFRI